LRHCESPLTVYAAAAQDFAPRNATILGTDAEAGRDKWTRKLESA
jgi:hypothetical protein